MASKYLKLIQRSIAEVMTPDRVAEMKAQMRHTLREHWRAKDKRVPLIHAAIASLDLWERCEDNPILVAEYVRRGKELFEEHESINPELGARLEELIEEIKKVRGIHSEGPPWHTAAAQRKF